MSYIRHKSPEIGDVIKTTIIHESMSGYFEIGTEVTIIEIDPARGYGIQDKEGNRMVEIGWII